MRSDRTLGILAVAFFMVLVIQLGVRWTIKPGVRVVASWLNSPNTVEEARRLADQIVLGRVVRVQRGDDLVVKAANEPGGEDRIPVEVVTIRVEKSYKGGRPATIDVFHTGLSRGDSPAEKGEPTGPPPSKPPGGVDRPGQPRRPSTERSRTFILEDDPPYRPGERVVLLLMEGPTVTVAGGTIKTKAVISPEGRYSVSAGNRLRPATRRKFALQFTGRALDELERELQR